AHSACFFSATLTPATYYHAMLGLPENSVHLSVPSPFHPDQLDIRIAKRLSTRYKDRARAILPICKIVHDQIIKAPGNALIFLSSYDFLQQIESPLRHALEDLDVRIVVQSRNMSELDRQAFIEQFSQHKNRLGIAVLGGAFSEGIDLPGDALKGVFIATLGLPQVNPINEHLRHVFQQRFQQGYDFAYTFPGLQKVTQAAGRVIRSGQDTGYLWLLDERYQQADIQALLPAWWKLP
ncbi:MAG TPA: helicase C-terminal domain-containing protein, partial [Pseudomonadales bacterium]|nr:helicase C-terminal domain-containing protein [Pseudomonadales bacterium]